MNFIHLIKYRLQSAGQMLILAALTIMIIRLIQH